MLAITDKRTSEVLGKYYDMLRATGYVKHDVVARILVNVFLLDFLNTVGTFVSDNDYKIISLAYRKLFADGNCLMSYPVFCVRKATLGFPTLLHEVFGYRQALSANEENRVTQLNDVRQG